jgi:hypothetical protein
MKWRLILSSILGAAVCPSLAASAWTEANSLEFSKSLIRSSTVKFLACSMISLNKPGPNHEPC